MYMLIYIYIAEAHMPFIIILNSELEQRELEYIHAACNQILLYIFALSLRPASLLCALPRSQQRAVDKWPRVLGGVFPSLVSKFHMYIIMCL